MIDTEYKAWARGIAKLTAEQRSDAKARLLLIDQVSVVASGKKDFGDRVTQAICGVLNKLGVECPSAAVLRKSAAYASSKGKFEDVSKFFGKVSSKRVVQDALLRVAIELLYFDLIQWQGSVISAHMLLSQIHRIPATLNKHFPGYAASGLLGKVVKAE